MRILSILSILFIASFGSLAAQQPTPRPDDMSRSAVLRRFTGTPNTAEFVRVLRQSSNRVVPTALLDEIGDSLVARAVKPRASSDPSSKAYLDAVQAVSTLENAGDLDGRGGRPYDGALGRLIQIHKASLVGPIRKMALVGVTVVAARPQALDYLETVAQSNDPAANGAVSVLIMDVDGGVLGLRPSTPSERQESLAILRDLYEHRKIANADAQHQLDQWLPSKLRRRRDRRGPVATTLIPGASAPVLVSAQHRPCSHVSVGRAP